MKKILSVTLAAALLLSAAGLSVFSLTFTDLEETHWAYADVQTLVTDGTVSGYEDGSFRPNGTVTRAEFVKMLGAGTTQRETDYSDVSAEHWAYPYVISAGFPEDGSNTFMPDEAITRGLVAELLWNRSGKPADAFAPSIITEQYATPQAAAWVYETGLMRGDDGIHLRLDDTLSRAEAAVLIIRARSAGDTKAVFAESVSPEILENVYNGLNLFDRKAYAPDDTITNGAMARAVVRIGSEETNLSYNRQNASADFEHPYARDLAIVCNYCIGEEKLSAEFADKPATFGDTVAALVYQFISKSRAGVAYGEKTDSLPDSINSMMNVCLTFAKNNGIISLQEDLSAPITVREFTAVCLLLDNVIGSQSDITTDIHPITSRPVAFDHSLLLTGVPYGDYRVMLRDMPAGVYKTAPVSQTVTPAESYNFAREYSGIFTDMLQLLKESVKERSGADVRLTYYPSLVWENGNGYTMRIKCEIVNMDGSKAFKDLFATAEGMEGAEAGLTQGSFVWFDLATGQAITSIQVTDEKAYAEQIVSISQH